MIDLAFSAGRFFLVSDVGSIQIVGLVGLDQIIKDLHDIPLHNGDMLPYKDAVVELKEFGKYDVKPSSFYVLKQELETQQIIRELLLKELGFDQLNLENAVMLAFQESTGNSVNRLLIPPIVEVNSSGDKVLIDGLHRISTNLGENPSERFKGILVSNALPDCPLPVLPIGWHEVKIYDDIKNVPLKRRYVPGLENPVNFYRALKLIETGERKSGFRPV